MMFLPPCGFFGLFVFFSFFPLVDLFLFAFYKRNIFIVKSNNVQLSPVLYQGGYRSCSLCCLSFQTVFFMGALILYIEKDSENISLGFLHSTSLFV